MTLHGLALGALLAMVSTPCGVDRRACRAHFVRRRRRDAVA